MSSKDRPSGRVEPGEIRPQPERESHRENSGVLAPEIRLGSSAVLERENHRENSVVPPAVR
jgi:hypothetical protein